MILRTEDLHISLFFYLFFFIIQKYFSKPCQDLPGACSITEVHDGLNLADVGDRKLFLIGTYTKAGQPELGSGVQDAHDLIVHLVNDRR